MSVNILSFLVLALDGVLDELVKREVDGFILTRTEDARLLDTDINLGLALCVDEALWKVHRLSVCLSPHVQFWLEYLFFNLITFCGFLHDWVAFVI